MRNMTRIVGLLGLIILCACGCRGSKCVQHLRPSDVKLPRWFTMPQGDEQTDTPVSLGIQLPKHLIALGNEFGLPHWVVYGVVRSLGAREFLANGTVKTFSVSDERGESSVVVDNVYYDVPADRIRAMLQAIAVDCAEAENELARHNALGIYVRRRFGGIILFSLDHVGELDTNLLLSSGVTKDPMETFDVDSPETLPVVGWRETASHYITTMPGRYMYGNPVLAFRRTEEEAIRDLAKTLLHKFSHMRKSVVDTASARVDDEIKEDTYREEITLRMRGVRVLRRAVDIDQGLCLVEVSVPRDGVAMK
jgi:hypothetical protein